jgi:hypothetical protein
MAFNDSSLWARLEGHVIMFQKSATMSDLNINIIHARRSSDHCVEFQRMINEGADTWLVTINGETSYLGPQCFKMIKQCLDGLEKEGEKANKLVPIETSQKINNRVKLQKKEKVNVVDQLLPWVDDDSVVCGSR